MNRARKPTSMFMLAGLLLGLYASDSWAQTNLISNPGFDSDLANWVILHDRTASWANLDASNSPSSGSALIGNIGTSSGGTPLVLSQCVATSSSTEYLYGGQVLIPSGQPSSTLGHIFVQSFDPTDCTGDVHQTDAESAGRVNEWELESSSFISSSAARSVRLAIGVSKPTGVSADAFANFDNLFLRRADSTGFRIIDERLSGSWYNPATPGQGFFLDISPQINLFFGGWFAWTTVPGEIDWTTVQGGFSGDVALVPIYRSSGGVFNDPALVTTVPVGMAEFRFFSCTSGQVSFEFVGTGATTVIPLQRIAPAFLGCSD